MSITLTSIWAMARIVLQTNSSDNPGKYQDMWATGDWFDAIVMPFLDLLGPIFPLAVGLGLSGILFIWSGGLALPIVVMIIIGGALIPVMPPEAQAGAVGLLLVGIAFGLYTAWMDGGTRR